MNDSASNLNLNPNSNPEDVIDSALEKLHVLENHKLTTLETNVAILALRILKGRLKNQN